MTVHTFKSSSSSPEIIKINKGLIRENYRNRRQTNVMVDTNILLTIEIAYNGSQRHKDLKDAGIVDLARLIETTSKYGVFISPAAAYQELPPGRRAPVEAAFERFCRNYLPKFRDDPNSVKVPFAGESFEPEAFSALSPERQTTIACSYASLLALNIIYRLEALDGFEKFTLYIDYCEEVLNLISLKELSIARYVFAPEKGMTDVVRTRKSATVNNFTKLKKGGAKGLTRVQELHRIALNGANDLKLISAADIVNNSREQFMFGVIEHDVWIATRDEKLYEFCRACPGFVGWGAGGPLARFVDTHADIKGTRYWKDTIDLQQQRLEARYATVDRAKEMDDIVAAAFNIEADLLDDRAIGYFSKRSWRSQG
ncbi:hypothetical protein [Rhizobium phaseoli]|uniref:hypothetical protein n=1 Tax=Rhizobium phaseoli TaxID=396 RepID=UPI0025562AF9|nr:hypothetical protein [Rhizobium phaseoli]MDK4729472.1 hypothetical protein [Rhizobium phaseoli]